MHRGQGRGFRRLANGLTPWGLSFPTPTPPPRPPQRGRLCHHRLAEDKTRLEGSRRRRPRSTRPRLRGAPRTMSPRTWTVNPGWGGATGRGRPLGRDGDGGTAAWHRKRQWPAHIAGRGGERHVYSTSVKAHVTSRCRGAPWLSKALNPGPPGPQAPDPDDRPVLSRQGPPRGAQRAAHEPGITCQLNALLVPNVCPQSFL